MPPKIQLRLSLSRKALDLVDAACQERDCERSEVIEGAILQALDPAAEDASRLEVLIQQGLAVRQLLLTILARLDGQLLEPEKGQGIPLTEPVNIDASTRPIATAEQVYGAPFAHMMQEEQQEHFEPPPSQKGSPGRGTRRRTFLGRLLLKGDAS